MDDTPRPDWRDGIQIHPAADLFPMMPDPELDRLARDIATNGLCTGPAWLSTPEGPRLIDGRNRFAAVFRIPDQDRRAELQQELRRRGTLVPAQTDPLAYVFSANDLRRHLKAADKRRLIGKLLEAYPGLSDRAIARLVGTSHTTVAAVRGGSNGQSGHKPAARWEASGRKARGHKAGSNATREQSATGKVPPPIDRSNEVATGAFGSPAPTGNASRQAEWIARLLHAVTGLAAMPADAGYIAAIVRSSRSAEPVDARLFQALAWLKAFGTEWEAARTTAQLQGSP